MNEVDIRIDLPSWAAEWERTARRYETDEDRMRVAIELARENAAREAGGPFGAALFESGSGRVVAVGVNSVVRLTNSTLHAEMIAFMRAQARLGRYTLGAPELPPYTLYASCDPCAMCLGATLWAGVRRVICAATREDAEALGFDEGPVFPESYAYLERRGILVEHGLLRDASREVLESYRRGGGVIYNS